ncbi:TonB-dependent receptor [Marinigracilibium pacificum]|uniref:TonB-dependent receptor n=1 Tax=Marinigracilibium pacificum TaxID=2729599 RepID=A0A848J2A5_9BACT|nr:TonB-dependent receptor [Marinigracilibium pacificum]NMM49458.1 TonB-dependent receptor [Marinigracilibium pacificum]
MRNLMTLMSLLFLFVNLAASAQQKFTISGYVKEASTGEALIGATVVANTTPSSGGVTNNYGFYSITLPKGQYQITVSFIGFDQKVLDIDLNENKKLNVELDEAGQELDEVVVTGKREDANIEDVTMSQEELEIEKIKAMPALFGEVDIVKSLQLLPGVQSAGEGTTGLFVRGGSYDQNLVLLDEATVYNASHFLGFFSVFNPDAVKKVTMYKGGIPAKYGGRLSSVVDIQMKEGNSKHFSGSGGIGTISSRLTLEGPIKKDVSSFIVTARRTYADLFLGLSSDPNIKNNQLYFYDFNAKANYRFSPKDQVFVSGYFGRDVFNFDNEFGLNWGNATLTGRWNHVFNDKLFLNTTALYSSFNYGFKVDNSSQNFEWLANLSEVAAKIDFTYFSDPTLTLSFGSHSMYHIFSPAEIKPLDEESIIQNFSLDEKYAFEQGLYFDFEKKLSEKLLVQAGLRYSLFANIGPGDVYIYENDEPSRDSEIIDTVSYSGGKRIAFYDGLEPRLNVRYKLNSSSSIKASYMRTMQYLQIAANSTAGLPIDRWIPADKYIEPLSGNQVALGYFKNFKNNTYEFSVEGYYKHMENVIDMLPEADVFLSNNIEVELSAGKGWAYGLEFQLQKNKGATTGWLSYTLSRTFRKVPMISNGDPYPARYDRIHDISLVLNHEFNKRVSMGMNFVYSSGQAVSFPVGRYEIDGQSVPYYDDNNRNSSRMPDYHRLDLSLTLKGKEKPGRKWKSYWNFSVYNAYARKNPFSIEFRRIYNNDVNFDPQEDGDPGKEYSSRPASVTTYLFSIIPSVSYNFSF